MRTKRRERTRDRNHNPRASPALKIRLKTLNHTLVSLIRRAHKAVDAIYTEEAPDGIPLPQVMVLGALVEGGSMCQASLLVASASDRSSLSEMLARMATAGLIARARSKADKRKLIVSITPAGRDAYRTARIVVQRTDRRVDKAMTATASEAIGPILTRIAEMETRA